MPDALRPDAELCARRCQLGLEQSFVELGVFVSLGGQRRRRILGKCVQRIFQLGELRDTTRQRPKALANARRIGAGSRRVPAGARGTRGRLRIDLQRFELPAQGLDGALHVREPAAQ